MKILGLDRIKLKPQKKKTKIKKKNCKHKYTYKINIIQKKLKYLIPNKN